MKLLTHVDLLSKFGAPEQEKNMVLWDVPAALEIGVLPKRLYCNRMMISPLSKAFKALIDAGAVAHLKTWDGCFNIRSKRSSGTPSLHSWGMAIDVNAAWNRLGQTPSMPADVVQCFKDAGFDWGGDWSHPDGMHFQLSLDLFNKAS